MAEYKAIHGFTVQNRTSDPVPSAAGSWATGGALNTARAGLGSAGNGTQTAALTFGGRLIMELLGQN